jgi:hypothetical protein
MLETRNKTQQTPKVLLQGKKKEDATQIWQKVWETKRER